MPKYTVGVDFGSLSARAVVVNVDNGDVVGVAIYNYPHAVMTEKLPDKTPITAGWALQHPQDYIDALYCSVSKAVESSGVIAEEIIGVGIDATSCSILPVDATGSPLCFDPRFKNDPNAYIKMWKHHGAQMEAEAMTEVAADMNLDWLKRFGGRVSSESMFPKILETAKQSPELHDAVYEYVEVNDWLVWSITGQPSKNSCSAGYKAYYSKKEGYISSDYLGSVDGRLENVVKNKLPTPVSPIGTRAGTLNEYAAKRMLLLPGTPVAQGMVDAHTCVPAEGIFCEGQMLMIMGTSSCHMLSSKKDIYIPGICGCVEDGILPGMFGYEAGQSCVGDMYSWFVTNLVPESYFEEAKRVGMNIHDYLSALAEKKAPGETGLLALDWLNGNRSTLSDFNLSAMILGMTMQTRAEDVYRALIESTAYGTRIIVENFREHGIPVKEFYVSGGICRKNKFAMQIYADVLNMEVHISGTEQGPALGSAIFAACAAGSSMGGYNSVYEAIPKMSAPSGAIISPNMQNIDVYDQLYSEYKKLYNYFGRENAVMKKVMHIKNNSIR